MGSAPPEPQACRLLETWLPTGDLVLSAERAEKAIRGAGTSQQGVVVPHLLTTARPLEWSPTSLPQAHGFSVTSLALPWGPSDPGESVSSAEGPSSLSLTFLSVQ